MRLPITIAAIFGASSVWAEPPRVLTDIAPIHSIVANVMNGVAEPDLLIPPGTDPHHFQMRPSQAHALSKTQVLVWVGDEMLPWLADATQTNAGSIQVSIELLDLSKLPMLIEDRTATFHFDDTIVDQDEVAAGSEDENHIDEHTHDSDEAEHADEHEHEHEHEHEDDHSHQSEEQDHADEHDDHQRDAPENAGHGHDHGDIDPHAWLDPLNAARLANVVADQLSALDTDNATTYRENAAAFEARVVAMVDELKADLAPVRRHAMVTHHEGFAYFWVRFGLNWGGGLSAGDGIPASAARMAVLQSRIDASHQICLFSQNGVGEKALLQLAPKDNVVGDLDEIGFDLDLGTGLYEALIREIAETIKACAG